jgi:hypothetical protein
VWERGAFYMTSLPEKAHVRRLGRDPRASFCVDVEDDERDDGAPMATGECARRW